MRIFILVLATVALQAQTDSGPVGVFEGQTDIGAVLHAGSAAYDEPAKAYTVTASGDNMWAAEDDFHFVWKKVTGDVTLTADIAFTGTGGNAHRKGVLMIRRTLEKDSDYVDAALHGVGLTSLQSRDQKGGSTREVQSNVSAPKRLRIEKRGDYFFMFVAGEGEQFHLSGGSMKLKLDEPFYVGIGACAHDKDAVEKVVFTNVALENGPSPTAKPALYSTIETVPVQSTDRRVTYVAAGRIEAPTWSKDGKSLLFNREGRMERVPSTGGSPEKIDSRKLTRIDHFHGLSPDGAILAVTDEQKGRAVIDTLPVAGGPAQNVTRSGLSYFHAWSPDGNTILYSGKRKGETAIMTIPKAPAAGAKEIVIAAGAGVNDNPVYSPDGKYIYFDSNRSGPTQIWRMHADGTEQEQVTNDDFANRMPHVSPDGKQVAFLSGAPDGPDVKIRSMLLATKAIRIIANLMGGAGTFEADPWSPDSRTLTFVSYQLVAE